MAGFRIAVRGLAVCLIGATVSMTAGCGQKGNAVAVTGTVTFQEKPLEGASVIFAPVSASEGSSIQLAIGSTDARGNFDLTTQVTGTDTLKGAAPGEYRVTISKLVPPKGMSEEEHQKLIDQEREAYKTLPVGSPGLSIAPSKVDLLPPKYSNSQATELKASVKSGETNDFKFDLK